MDTLTRTSQPDSAVSLRSIFPACSRAPCSRNRALWHNLLNRRNGIHCDTEWYCSPECLEQALGFRLHAFLSEPIAASTGLTHRIPIGLLLLSRGAIEHESLQQALRLQRSEGGRIGDCLRKICALSEEQVTSALASQWSCPVYPSSGGSECRHLIPHRLQEFHRMLPVHFVESARDLYVAFEQRVDYTVLVALEQMLGCHTRPCILPASELDRRMSQETTRAGEPEIVLESVSSSRELARILTGYVQQVGAEHLRILVCGPHLWIRLRSSARVLDMLVRRWHS